MMLNSGAGAWTKKSSQKPNAPDMPHRTAPAAGHLLAAPVGQVPEALGSAGLHPPPHLEAELPDPGSEVDLHAYYLLVTLLRHRRFRAPEHPPT